ncbi:MAG: transporter [Desulfobacteraceae bacterium]|nr:transporter [Desulfobacteraceae bacterium]
MNFSTVGKARFLFFAAMLLTAARARGQDIPDQPVGQAPPEKQAEEVAIFPERGVLTPKGSLVVEPSFEYIHSSATQVAIEGFTVIPAVAIGLINVSELQRDTMTAALAFRLVVTNRLEVEAKVPYVYKVENVREREFSEGTPLDIITDSSGNDLGDVECAVHYQVNRGDHFPYLIANVRAKSRTGTDPFEVEREVLRANDGTPIGEVFKEQPTGSGFWGVQPSVTLIYPTDPAVLYFNVNYLWNVERNVGGDYGTVDPGDSAGVSFGMGFAVNERTSFSLGYDHSVVFKSSFEHDAGLEPVFNQIQIGTFLVGVSHRLSDRVNFNLSLGIGVTNEAPDVQLLFRLPVTVL